MANFTSCVACACGAKYERAEVSLPIKDIGVYECRHCGAHLEHWSGRVVPQFRELTAPKAKKAQTAA